jgi:hypothetical protein
LLLPCNHSCTNAPQCYIIHTLPVLLLSNFSYRYCLQFTQSVLVSIINHAYVFSVSHKNFISEAVILNLSLELTGHISITITRSVQRASAVKIPHPVFFWTLPSLLNLLSLMNMLATVNSKLFMLMKGINCMTNH